MTRSDEDRGEAGGQPGAADPRHSPGREPVGAHELPRLIAVTAVTVAAATAVLVLILLLG